MIGIANVDKPVGLTSHDVVARARRALGTKKIGHGGTLDPAASGVLVLAVGPATRVLQYLPTEPKVYECDIALGTATNTQDAEGEVVDEQSAEHVTLASICEAASGFLGAISQVPPMYSAIKHAGKPLYAYARRGIDIDREPRNVEIHSLEIDVYEPPIAKATVVCSGGTYIRTLAHDLGRALGTCAHLASLRRTAVGKFTLESALRLEELAEDRLIPLDVALEPFKVVRLPEQQAALIRNGQPIRLPQLDSERFATILDEQGEFLAVAESVGDVWQPRCVVPTMTKQT